MSVEESLDDSGQFTEIILDYCFCEKCSLLQETTT